MIWALLANWKKIKEIVLINEYYLVNFFVDVDEDVVALNINGVFDINGRLVKYGIPFRPHIKTKDVNIEADMVFKDFELSNNGKTHFSLCLTGVNPDVSHITYSTSSFIDLFLYKFLGNANEELNLLVDAGVDNAIAVYTDTENCIDLTNHIALGFPEFVGMDIQHTGSKIENDKVSVYGCPIAKEMLGDEVVVSDKPCETVAYNIFVYTAKDIGDAETASRITLTLCGEDISGKTSCFPAKEIRNGQVFARFF